MAVYALIASEGQFTVQAFAEGLLSSLGHNPMLAVRDFAGQIDFDPAAADKASVEITVQAASLEVTDEVSRKDRQEIEDRTRNEVLETATYPDIVYQAAGAEVQTVAENQYKLRFSGALVLHGVKINQIIDVALRLGDGDVRLQGSVRLKQSAYRIKRVSALAGAIRVKDELQLSFEIVGRKAAG